MVGELSCSVGYTLFRDLYSAIYFSTPLRIRKIFYPWSWFYIMSLSNIRDSPCWSSSDGQREGRIHKRGFGSFTKWIDADPRMGFPSGNPSKPKIAWPLAKEYENSNSLLASYHDFDSTTSDVRLNASRPNSSCLCRATTPPSNTYISSVLLEKL